MAMELSRLKVVVLGLIVAVAVAISVVVLRSERSQDLVLKVEPAEDKVDVTVYVGGAVKAAGLYSLPAGSPVADALAAAGGPVDAEISAVPMADELQDGQEIFMPEAGPGPPQGADQVAAVGGAPGAPATLNVNTASAAELERLPGVGPVLVQRIVTYRTEHGPFATLDDLADVRGISSRMIEDFEGLATTGSSP
jgi:competence protein ComEA